MLISTCLSLNFRLLHTFAIFSAFNASQHWEVFKQDSRVCLQVKECKNDANQGVVWLCRLAEYRGRGICCIGSSRTYVQDGKLKLRKSQATAASTLVSHSHFFKHNTKFQVIFNVILIHQKIHI